MAAVKKSGTGLSKETAGALAYLLGPITGVIFLIIEKDPFVKFHAMQSVVVFGGLLILDILLIFTIILLTLTPIIGIISFILWLLLMYKAWQGEEWEVPFVGKYARKFLKKV